MEFLYPEPILYLPLVIGPPPRSCNVGTFWFGSEDSPEPEEHVMMIDSRCFPSGEKTIVLQD
jgi:hypothetical protein